MQVIENEKLKVSINEVGAVLTSVIYKKTNKELLFQIDERYWKSQDVVLFPIIGQYDFKVHDKNYHIPTRHGFLRVSTFKIEEKKEDEVTLSYESNASTLEVYPYEFKFIIKYSLKNDKLNLDTEVINHSKETIYFSYGSHNGYVASTKGFLTLGKGVTEYYPLVNNEYQKPVEFKEPKKLVFDKSLFKKYDTILFNNDFKPIEVDTGYGFIIKYNFDAPLFALWSNATAGDFYCLEPWWGIPGYSGDPLELSKRKFENACKTNTRFHIDIEYIEKV